MPPIAATPHDPPAAPTPRARARRRALRVGALVAVLAVVGVLPAGAAPDAESKAKTEVAAELAAYAAWCAQNGAKTAGAAAVEEAKALDEQAPGVADADAALAALGEDAADAAAKVTAQRKLAGPKVAKAYDHLVAAVAADKTPARSEAWLLASLGWEASKPRLGRAQKALDEATKANRKGSVARLLAGMRKADPDGASKYDRVEVELATKGLHLLASADHPLLAWISLPHDWARGKKYPVLVGVEGAGSGFEGYARASAAARGSRAAIVVTPCGFTNTNALEPAKYAFYDADVLKAYDSRRMDFDGPGMEKILEIVRTRFGGDEKVFLTGFSGGGNYCYWKLLTDPDHVRGAAPACANYSGYGLTTTPTPQDGGPPVHLMTGANDPHKDHVFGNPPGIEGQTDAVESKLKELGWTHVTRVQLQAGHDPLHAEVWKFVDRVLGK